MTPVGFQGMVAFVWKVADKRRGTFKQRDNDWLVVPHPVHHRVDANLTWPNAAVLRSAKGFPAPGVCWAQPLQQKTHEPSEVLPSRSNPCHLTHSLGSA